MIMGLRSMRYLQAGARSYSAEQQRRCNLLSIPIFASTNPVANFISNRSGRIVPADYHGSRRRTDENRTRDASRLH
jgi:hypothetical protein